MTCQMTTPAMISSNTLSRFRATQSWRWSNIHPSMQEGPMLSTLWGDLWESESGHLRHCYNSILSRHPVEGLINRPQRSLHFVLDLRNLTGYRFEFKPRSMHWRLREPQRRSNSWLLIMDPFCPISYARISIVHWISLLRPADAVSSWFLCDLSRLFTSHLLHRLQRLYFTFARVPFRLPASSNFNQTYTTWRPPAKNIERYDGKGCLIASRWGICSIIYEDVILYSETGNSSSSIGHPLLQAEDDTCSPASTSVIHSSISPPPNKRTRMNWNLGFPQMLPSPATVSPYPERNNDILYTEDETNGYPTALGPKLHPAKDKSSLISDNLRQRSTSALELNARLTRNKHINKE